MSRSGPEASLADLHTDEIVTQVVDKLVDGIGKRLQERIRERAPRSTEE